MGINYKGVNNCTAPEELIQLGQDYMNLRAHEALEKTHLLDFTGWQHFTVATWSMQADPDFTDQVDHP